MDYGAWTFWINLLLIVISGTQGVYIWINRRHEVTDARVKFLEGQQAELMNKFTRLEVDVEHLPTHHDIHGLLKTLSDFRAEVGELAGKLGGVNRAVDLINRHLLDRS